MFGGDATSHSFADFGRTDSPGDYVAHGEIHGPVTLFAADTGLDEPSFAAEGLLFSLLGAADPTTLHRWFDALSEHGEVVDPLQRREWGAHDGQVNDQLGLTWLIGYQGACVITRRRG